MFPSCWVVRHYPAAPLQWASAKLHKAGTGRIILVPNETALIGHSLTWKEIGLSLGGHRTQIVLGSEFSNHDILMPGDHCYHVAPCFCPHCSLCTLYWFQIFSVLDTPLTTLPWFTLPQILGDILPTTWTQNKLGISQVVFFYCNEDIRCLLPMPTDTEYIHWQTWLTTSTRFCGLCFWRKNLRFI